MNILNQLPRPFFVLAPMDDVTDTVFRQIMLETAPPDLFYTEFMNVDGFCSPVGKKAVAKKVKKTDKEQPIIAQIWGKTPVNYQQTARELVQLGYDGVDINMGCPVKTVVKNGCCSALINDRDKAKIIIDQTKKGLDGDIPISVKTRLGWKEVDLSWIEFLLTQDLDMLTIHMRTARDMSKVPARWEYMEQIISLRDKISPGTLIVGNGDVETKEQGLKLAKRYSVDGIMIGRGVFKDPYIFGDSSPWENISMLDKLNLYKKHINLYKNTWGDAAKIAPLNKFCKIYVNGFDGARELRDRLMHVDNYQALTDEIDNYIVNHSSS